MKKIKGLNKKQNSQLEKQWKNNQHENHEVDIILSGHGEGIKNLLVHKGVWNPAVASSRYYASYLYYNNSRLFAGKTAIDMGAGTGIMGLVMALNGAKKVIFSDISLVAVANVNANIEKFSLQKKVVVLQGNLFQNIQTKADFIVFNHPFFEGLPELNDTIASSMLDLGDLTKEFLQKAAVYLKPGGSIMMPFYSMAGEMHNPSIQGPKYGFKTSLVFRSVSISGLQTGEICIYELKF